MPTQRRMATMEPLSNPNNSPGGGNEGGGSGITVGFVYDLVVEARSTEGNGVCARHGRFYGDSAGFAIGEGQAGACCFRRRPDDLGRRNIAAGRGRAAAP